MHIYPHCYTLLYQNKQRGAVVGESLCVCLSVCVRVTAGKGETPPARKAILTL